MKAEESIPEVAIQVAAAIPAVKEEPDQEMVNALAVIGNVCPSQNIARSFSSRPSSPTDKLEERREIFGRGLRFYEALKDRAGNLPDNH